MNVKIGVAPKAPALVFYKAKSQMSAQTLLRILLHIVAGAIAAIYLAPEGPAIVLGSLALLACAKAVYDYFASGSIGIANAAALLAGAALAALFF